MLPKILIKPVLEFFHDSPMGGHGGIQNTVDLLSENFYFDKLPTIVSEYVQSCHDCQTRKMTQAHTQSGIISYSTPSEPFQVWQIDLYGPLPMSQRAQLYIFSALDMFSKFVYNVPLPNCDAKLCLTCFVSLECVVLLFLTKVASLFQTAPMKCVNYLKSGKILHQA